MLITATSWSSQNKQQTVYTVNYLLMTAYYTDKLNVQKMLFYSKATLTPLWNGPRYGVGTILRNGTERNGTE